MECVDDYNDDDDDDNTLEKDVRRFDRTHFGALAEQRVYTIGVF
jgi:hypothetical protein